MIQNYWISPLLIQNSEALSFALLGHLLKLFNIFVMVAASSTPWLDEVGQSVFSNDVLCVKVLESTR